MIQSTTLWAINSYYRPNYIVVIHPWTRQKCLLLVLGNYAGGGNTVNQLQHICKELITDCDVMKLLLLYKKLQFKSNMFKPFQCISILGHGVELQDIIYYFFWSCNHGSLAVKNKHPMTSLLPTKYEQAGSSFESEYLASKPRIKMSIIMLIIKPISKQFLKQCRHRAKYLVRYLHLPSKHMTPENSINTGMVTDTNCSQRWWH